MKMKENFPVSAADLNLNAVTVVIIVPVQPCYRASPAGSRGGTFRSFEVNTGMSVIASWLPVRPGHFFKSVYRHIIKQLHHFSSVGIVMGGIVVPCHLEIVN